MPKKAPQRLTLADLQRQIGEIVLGHLTSTATPTGPEEHARRTVIDWVVAAVDARPLKAMAALLPLDVFSWPASTRAGRREDLPEEPERGNATDGWLTAAALNPAVSEFDPKALDLPLPKDAPLRQIDAVRQAILDYLYQITWGQSKGSPAELRRRINRAAARLHETALIVQASYDEIAEEMSQRQPAKAAKGTPRRRVRWNKDDQIPF